MQSDRADRPPDGAYRISGVGIKVVVIVPPYRRGQIQRFQNRRRELGKEPDVLIYKLFVPNAESDSQSRLFGPITTIVVILTIGIPLVVRLQPRRAPGGAHHEPSVASRQAQRGTRQRRFGPVGGIRPTAGQLLAPEFPEGLYSDELNIVRPDGCQFERPNLICQVWRYVRIVSKKVTRVMIVTSIIGGAGAKRPLHAEHGAGHPRTIKGFGPVKEDAAESALERRDFYLVPVAHGAGVGATPTRVRASRAAKRKQQLSPQPAPGGIIRIGSPTVRHPVTGAAKPVLFVCPVCPVCPACQESMLDGSPSGCADGECCCCRS